MTRILAPSFAIIGQYLFASHCERTFEMKYKKCCFKYCKNIQRPNDRKLSFFSFPIQPFRREQWIEVLQIQNDDPSFRPTPRMLICSDHFDEKDKYVSLNGFIRLIGNSVPRVDPIRDKNYLVKGKIPAPLQPGPGSSVTNTIVNSVPPGPLIDAAICIGDIDVTGKEMDATQLTGHDNPFLPGTKLPENTVSDSDVESDKSEQDPLDVTPIKIKKEDTRVNQETINSHEEANCMRTENCDLSIDKFGEYVVTMMKKMPAQDVVDLQPQIVKLIASVMEKNKTEGDW